MRYHLFKSSKTKFILITDSQGRHFESGHLNLLSLPGATIKDVYHFVPPINQYCKIILFIGGNDLYNGCKPSDKTPIDIANQLIELANFLTERTKEVYLIGIPERNENKQRSAAVNEILEKVSHRTRSHKPSVNWKYRGISQHISGAKYFNPKDHLHLNECGRSNLHHLIKQKILYKDYNLMLNNSGHSKIYECKRNSCTCICSTW